MVKFFSTHCPKCNVLKAKLEEKNVEYEEVDSIDEMLAIGIKSAPNIQLEDGTLLDFSNALKWVKEQ